MGDFKLIKGTYRHIEDVYSAIERDINNFLINLTPFSIISPSSSLNVDELDQSFMYTQLLKEIIMDTEYDTKKAIEEFIQYCLEYNAQDTRLETLNKFKQNYENHSPIWWYTKEGFVYFLLNRALRTQEVESIIKMGFFIQDLHQAIEHKYSEVKHPSKITVYRGQGLSQANFEKLQKSKGGLFSFNSFLSTSSDRTVSYMFAESSSENHNMMGVLFKMEIDPTLSSTPFISLDGISDFEMEAEILFSMHTVFRIGDIVQIDDRLWEVCLMSTSDNDPQLKTITNFMRKEISFGDPWTRNITGTILLRKGEYLKALRSYKQFLELSKPFFPENHLAIVQVQSNIALTYYYLGDFSNALLYLHKVLETHQHNSLIDNPTLSTIYNSLALVYESLANYPDALSYFVKVLQIQQDSMPTGYPDLALTFSNIASVHFNMGEYSKAHSYLQKALEFELKYLPSDHPVIGTTYGNAGMVLLKMADHSNALCYYQKALEIRQKSLSSNHPDIRETYTGISLVHFLMRDYSTALFYSQKALENLQQALPADHPSLAVTHMNLGAIYESTGECSTALIHLEKALEVYQKSLSSNHPNFALIYINMGAVHQSLGDYSVALSYYQKALEIQQKILPPTHPDLANTYNSINIVSQLNQDWASAVSNAEKLVEIQQKHFQSGQSIQITNPNDANEMFKNYSELSPKLKELVKIQQNMIPSLNSNTIMNAETIDGIRKIRENLPDLFSNMEKTLMSLKKCPSTTSPFFNGILIDSNDETAIMDHCMTGIKHVKEAFNMQQFSSLLEDQEVDTSNETDDEHPFSTNNLC